MELDDKLQQALATRINLQISLSSIPTVEEWMDAPLSRWLDSVPLPPELPAGTSASFRISLASDLSRLRWAAFGPPSGFVPKMAGYLDQCGIAGDDLALINGLGEALEPQLVGSWISVVDGEVRTGWQFSETRPLVDLAPHLGAHEVTARLMAWVQEHRIAEFRRFAQAIGKQPFSELELLLPAWSPAEQVDLVGRGFEDFLATPLPEPVASAAAGAAAGGLSLVLRIADGDIQRVSVVIPGLGNDTVTAVCAAAGVEYKAELRQLQGMMGAEQIHALEYRQQRGVAGGLVDLHLVPGVGQRAPNLRRN